MPVAFEPPVADLAAAVGDEPGDGAFTHRPGGGVGGPELGVVGLAAGLVEPVVIGVDLDHPAGSSVGAAAPQRAALAVTGEAGRPGGSDGDGVSGGAGDGAGVGVDVEVVDGEPAGDGGTEHRRFDHRGMTGGGEVFAELAGAVGRVAEHVCGHRLRRRGARGAALCAPEGLRSVALRVTYRPRRDIRRRPIWAATGDSRRGVGRASPREGGSLAWWRMGDRFPHGTCQPRAFRCRSRRRCAPTRRARPSADGCGLRASRQRRPRCRTDLCTRRRVRGGDVHHRGP